MKPQPLAASSENRGQLVGGWSLDVASGATAVRQRQANENRCQNRSCEHPFSPCEVCLFLYGCFYKLEPPPQRTALTFCSPPSRHWRWCRRRCVGRRQSCCRWWSLDTMHRNFCLPRSNVSC